jgi:hypothetical protein
MKWKEEQVNVTEGLQQLLVHLLRLSLNQLCKEDIMPL